VNTDFCVLLCLTAETLAEARGKDAMKKTQLHERHNRFRDGLVSSARK
jgi:hypothetical protein